LSKRKVRTSKRSYGEKHDQFGLVFYKQHLGFGAIRERKNDWQV